METDKIIITNLPAFYKINLFNRISNHEKIFVIFTGNTAEIRNNDFFKQNLIKFNFIDLKNKSSVYCFFFMVKLFMSAKYNQLIIGGWDEPLLWMASVLSKKKKNSVIVESSIYESKIHGIKSIVKKLFLKRISKAYASGNSQVRLLQALKFKGLIIKTKGVGIFNIHPQPYFEERNKVINFLYVGRLSKEKNLEKLIKVFKELPELVLHIIGFGPDEEYLKSIASENIKFHGAVKNTELHKFYKLYDVFILPSIAEPWGLVVEEALNNGMPVIISNKVGCGDEIVIDGNNGLIFKVEDENDMKVAVIKIRNLHLYNHLRRNVSEMNFEETAKRQIEVYLEKNNKTNS